MSLLKKIIGSKAEPAMSLAECIESNRDQLPPCCNSVKTAEWTKSKLDAIENSATDHATLSRGGRYSRAMRNALPKVYLADRHERAVRAMNEQLTGIGRVCDQAARSHQVATAATEAAQSKLASAQKQQADLELERDAQATAAAVALETSFRRVQEAVAGEDVVAEEEAGKAHAEAEERQRALRTTLSAMEARISARAARVAQLKADLVDCEEAEREAERQVYLANVRLAAAKSDQAMSTYLAGLAGVQAAMDEARSHGVEAGAMVGYSALSGVRVWAGDTARTVVGAENDRVRSGLFDVNYLLQMLKPLDAADLATLQSLDDSTLAALSESGPGAAKA